MKGRKRGILKWILAFLGILSFVLAFAVPLLWLPESSTGSAIHALTEWSAPERSPAIEREETRFVRDLFCRSCRHAMATPEARCGATLPGPTSQQSEWTRQQQQQAGARIAAMYPETCTACNPTTCGGESNRTFWRYEPGAPPVIQETSVPQIAAVPAHYRLPESLGGNITSYLLSSKEHVYPSREYLFDYNPSLVALPESRPKKNGATVVYVASFRVSNQHYCLHPADRKLMNGGSTVKPQNWLGLAFLDVNMNVLTDTVLDLRPVGFSGAEDFRLFLLHDQLYITSYDVIAPIYWSPGTGRRAIPTVFGNDNNQSSFGTVYVRSFVSCAPCGKKRGYCGKNFNYFSSPSSTALATNAWAEIWPSPPHSVRSVNLTAPCRRGQEPEQATDDRDESSVQPSFATVEEVYFPHLSPHESLLTRGRGGACCIPLEHNGSTVLVGIRHAKTPSQRNRRLSANVTSNHYLSQLYAFAPDPPFRMVAQSGYFCLGFGTADSLLVRLTSWRKLELGRVFECPRIHFVSGMTLRADDPSLAILAYGVNDCLSRFVQVRVSDLLKLLFQSPASL